MQFIKGLTTKPSINNVFFSPLLVTILYIALGPGPIKRIDLSHLLYGDTWSWLLYTALLATSVLSVGISFSKVPADVTISKLEMNLRDALVLSFQDHGEGPILGPSPCHKRLLLLGCSRFPI